MVCLVALRKVVASRTLQPRPLAIQSPLQWSDDLVHERHRSLSICTGEFVCTFARKSLGLVDRFRDPEEVRISPPALCG